ncbi:hypothetical protein N9Y42_02300 [Mariniblastus sp.]|nr:hypothetical protein [Mariniblastus sp.]
MKTLLLMLIALFLSCNLQETQVQAQLLEPESQSRSGVGFRYVNHPEPPARLFVGENFILDSAILESVKQPQVKLSQLVLAVEKKIESVEGNWTLESVKRNKTGKDGWYWQFSFTEHNDDRDEINDRYYSILALNNGKLFLPEVKTYYLSNEFEIIEAMLPPRE